jgi:hypothetical protein
MARGLAWIKTQNFQGYGCSECDWEYKPSGAIAGDSLQEMKRKYEAERDKEFPAHVCLKRSKSPDGTPQ